MREILFRGKVIDDYIEEDLRGKWVEGDLIYGSLKRKRFAHIWPIIDDPDYRTEIPVIPETVGQFTGLHDKNGKKIFEGDVVTCNISYEMGGYPYCARITSPVIYNYGIFKPLHRCDDYSVEVIGNIYDNPELLEVKK